MNDRDTFAAAALTGLLAGRLAPYESEYAKDFAEAAWKLADAMLAERGDTTDHDAAPAATASEAENQAVGRRAETSAGEAGTGDTRAAQEPAAWGIYCGDEIDIACLSREGAAACVRDWPQRAYKIVPLYAAPPAGSVALTDEERCELEAAASEYESGAEKIVYGRAAYYRRAATIRGLLARAAKEGR
jgi:hypothetical protein